MGSGCDGEERMSEGEREQELETRGRQIRETEARPRNFYLRAGLPLPLVLLVYRLLSRPLCVTSKVTATVLQPG